MPYPNTTFSPETATQHQAVLKLSEQWTSLRAASSAPTPPPSIEQPTLEQVRSKLTELSRDGKTLEVKALLKKFGATSLNLLAPQHFAAVLAEGSLLC